MCKKNSYFCLIQYAGKFINFTLKRLTFILFKESQHVLSKQHILINGGTLPRGGDANQTFVFFLYFTACQHSAQKASNQRHGQPASTDICERVSQSKQRFRRGEVIRRQGTVQPFNEPLFKILFFLLFRYFCFFHLLIFFSLFFVISEAIPYNFFCFIIFQNFINLFKYFFPSFHFLFNCVSF